MSLSSSIERVVTPSRRAASLAASFLSGAALVAGCAAHATEGQLHARAARELSCPHDNLRTREVDEKTRWVTGCGKSATYREVCKRGRDGETCKWAQVDEAGNVREEGEKSAAGEGKKRGGETSEQADEGPATKAKKAPASGDE